MVSDQKCLQIFRLENMYMFRTKSQTTNEMTNCSILGKLRISLEKHNGKTTVHLKYSRNLGKRSVRKSMQYQHTGVIHLVLMRSCVPVCNILMPNWNVLNPALFYLDPSPLCLPLSSLGMLKYFMKQYWRVLLIFCWNWGSVCRSEKLFQKGPCCLFAGLMGCSDGAQRESLSHSGRFVNASNYWPWAGTGHDCWGPYHDHGPGFWSQHSGLTGCHVS